MGEVRRQSVTNGRYDWGRTSPTVALIELIADIEGVRYEAVSTATGLTLADEFDSDALDEFVKTVERLHLRFTVHEYTVVIDDDAMTVTKRRGHDASVEKTGGW